MNTRQKVAVVLIHVTLSILATFAILFALSFIAGYSFFDYFKKPAEFLGIFLLGWVLCFVVITAAWDSAVVSNPSNETKNGISSRIKNFAILWLALLVICFLLVVGFLFNLGPEVMGLLFGLFVFCALILALVTFMFFNEKLLKFIEK